jgi:hypothetical protein
VVVECGGHGGFAPSPIRKKTSDIFTAFFRFVRLEVGHFALKLDCVGSRYRCPFADGKTKTQDGVNAFIT